VKNDISSSKKPFYRTFLACNASYLLRVNSVGRSLVEIALLEKKTAENAVRSCAKIFILYSSVYFMTNEEMRKLNI